MISKYGENAKIHLGGIPMIADDMMSYIKSDIVVFGIGVFIFIIITLWFLDLGVTDNGQVQYLKIV